MFPVLHPTRLQINICHKLRTIGEEEFSQRPVAKCCTLLLELIKTIGIYADDSELRWPSG